MITTLDHRLISSFKEYLSYRILTDLQAFSTKTMQLYQYSDTRFANKVMYGAPYANWVYDSLVDTIPTSIGGLVRGGAEGLRIDFKNGRAILNSGNTGLNLSITTPVQDFGIFVTTRPDAALVNEVNFNINPELAAATTYLPPDKIHCPCIFVKLVRTNNKPFALSGLDWTSWNIRVIVFAQNYYQIMGIGGCLRDLKERQMPILQASEFPMTEFNDIKGGAWNYGDYLTNPDETAFVMDSVFDILENDTMTKMNPKIFIGISEISVQFARQPRTSNSLI